MLYAVANNRIYEATDRVPEAARVSLAVAREMVKSPGEYKTQKVGKAVLLIPPKPKAEPTPPPAEGEVDILAVAGSLRENLPFDATVQREGKWLWVYGVAKADKESHKHLRKFKMTYSDKHESPDGSMVGGWYLKPSGKPIRYKGYRNVKNSKHEVEVLS